MPKEAVDQALWSVCAVMNGCFHVGLTRPDRDLEHGVNPYLLIYSPAPARPPLPMSPEPTVSTGQDMPSTPQEVPSYTDHGYL